MEHSDLLRYSVTVLEKLGLEYLVTGSTATIYFGEPRFTNDIDIVVRFPPRLIEAFCAAFPEDEFYVSEEAIADAIRTGGQFNVIHPTSGLKVDFMTPVENEFEVARFRRAVRVRPDVDYEARFASPEDVIIRKMEYYREGGSEKHLRDITGVLKTSHAKIDYGYIAEWASRKGLSEIWTAILEKLGK